MIAGTIRPSIQADERITHKPGNKGSRWDAQRVPGHTCRECGREMSIMRVHETEAVPWPADLALCVRCVRLALARMAVLRHGVMGEPASSLNEGHEARMAWHVSRAGGGR